MTPSQFIPKRYYSSLSRVTSAWFIITRKARDSHTSFRGVVHHAQIRIENALDSYCKLNTIGSLRLCLHDEFPKEVPQNQLQSKHIQMLARCR